MTSLYLLRHTACKSGYINYDIRRAPCPGAAEPIWQGW